MSKSKTLHAPRSCPSNRWFLHWTSGTHRKLGECNSAGYIVKEEAFSCIFLKMNMIHLSFHVPQTFMYFSPCGWSLTKIIVKIRAIRFPTDGVCMYVSLRNPRETRQRRKTLATNLKELPVLYISKHPASYSAKCTKIKITQEEWIKSNGGA